jgi:effector-binding domain-containing protein
MCIYHDRCRHCHPASPDARLEAVCHHQSGRNGDLPRVQNQRMRAYTIPNYDLVASVIHVGADNIRHLTAQAVWRWIERNNFRLAAPPREIYLRRGKPERPEDNITEMQYPWKKLKRG